MRDVSDKKLTKNTERSEVTYCLEHTASVLLNLRNVSESRRTAGQTN